MKLNKKRLLEIGLFITFIVFIASVVMNKPIGDMDEIWNYNFANCVSKGLVPYRDFSMVQTPLLPMITGLFLNVFSNSLIVMRIIAILLGSSIMFLIYKILDRLKVKRSLNLLSVMALLFILKDYFCIDYNFFAVFLTLLIIYLELVLDTKKGYSNLLIGIVAGFTFLTKQTIGMFVCISIIVYKLIIEIYNRKNNQKQENKLIKNLLYRTLGIIIPNVILLIYLIANNALKDFMDYAVLGIKTFSNSISYTNLISFNSIITMLLAIYIPISFIIMLIHVIRHKDKNLLIILLLSLSSFVLAFPISDRIHFLIGIIPSVVGNIYLVHKFFKKIYKPKLLGVKLFLNAFSILIVLYVFIVGITNYYISIKENNYYCKLNHFENLPISEEYEKEILLIDDFIKSNEKHVYIVNFTAALYMIPLDIYNKDFDMLMKGNFGAKGEEGLIETIKESKDSLYLVLNSKFRNNWQHPHEVTNYIKQNLKHIGSIENYEIYLK